MNDLLLFPCWKKIAVGRNIPVYQRVVWLNSEMGRSLVAFLSLVGTQARLTVRWEECGAMVCPIVSNSADGISSLSRAFQWAEWQISDLDSEVEPRKRSKKASKSASVEKEAA